MYYVSSLQLLAQNISKVIYIFMPKCVRCGVLKPVASFGFKKNATAMKQCAICRSKCRTYVNSDVGKTILKTYKETEKGKATIARCLKTPRSEASKLYVKQNHYLERCKVKRNEWNTSTRGQEVLERYKERRKELDKQRCADGRQTLSFQKYKKTWKYEQLKIVLAARLKARRQADTGMRIQDALMSCMYSSLKGVHHSSSMSQLTEFTSSKDIEAFYTSKFKPGMRLSNFGWFWNQEHIIARSHYDWNDTEDIRRCNCKSNLTPEYTSVNFSKGKKLPPNDILAELGPSVWPKSWRDKIPTAVERKELEKLRRRTAPGTVLVQRTVYNYIGK